MTLDPLEPDLLSPQAIAVLKFNADNAYRTLRPTHRGDPEVAAMIRALTPANMMQSGNPHPLLEIAIGALWLWHDFLDEAHKIAQDHESPEGSWLHAIVHRRAGDLANSRYWYLRSRMASADGLVHQVGEDPNDPRYQSAVQSQRNEWRALFKHCVNGD